MEISGFPHYENVCSNILKFYLDPTNEHGLKDLVLNSIIQLVDIDFKFDTDLESIEIKRELQTINGNRLDLLIETENYVIGIENKIFHHLHNDLTDYNNTINSYCFNTKKPICIVLSLNKLTSPDDLTKIRENNFINISYEQVFQKVKNEIGKHLSGNNLNYTYHLTDFIKSIENLTPKNMENKTLWSFFKNNNEAIQELTTSFTEFKNSFYQKIYQLNDALPQIEFAPLVDKQWIYDGYCLVHDYTIEGKYKIAIDTYAEISGWEIQIFARNNQSSEYLFNTMCKDNDFLPKPVESYERKERLIYQKFDADTEISIIAENLTELLTRIENYKKRTEEQ